MVQKIDRLVTLFGGAGFVGRYVAQAFYKAGWRVRVAQRDPRQAWFLRPLGGMGQSQAVATDVRRRDLVKRALVQSDAVVNLVGSFRGDLQKIHVDGARNIAEAARAAGVASLVQISAIGADPEAPSEYGRTKGEAEQAVREAFPNATILRPSVVFGREDDFLNRFAGLARMLPILPVIRGGTKFQPVFAADVGRAVAAAAADPRSHGGKLYELGGPQVLTMRELNEWICEMTGRDRWIVDVPDPLAKMLAGLFGWMPGAPLSWDQWLLLQRDNIVSGDHPGLRAFGITPTPLAAVTAGWLTAYRRHGRFAAKQPY
jgi:NADH dehydrogenase